MEPANDIEKKLDEAILRNRRTKATIKLGSGGKALANTEVELEQTGHQFLFGTNWGDSTIEYASGALQGPARDLAESRNQRFLALFNQATLPFYWGRFEPRRGQPDTVRILKAAEWYKKHGVALKGHPLCWHTITAPWLLDLSDQEILRVQKERIRRDVADFAGLIDSWDVVNEAVIMPVFDKYDNGISRICRMLGRIELIRTMFDEARATNPKATFLINDFDMSPAYDILIEGCLAAGIKFDAIGLQSHMHQGYWGVAKTTAIVERFERFGLPLHFSENTILSGQIMPPEIVDLNDYQVSSWPSTPEGEERQAREVVLHYKSLFARPSVASITWWDLSDGCWLGAPAGLLHDDHRPKPAYEALLQLVKRDWWTPRQKLRTDSQGQLDFTGFQGSYRLTVGDTKTSFDLHQKGTASISLHL